MSEPAPTQPTHVVTCFVLRSGPDGDRVLVVRRSERVRTYRGKWAAISGYLEPHVTPLEQAYTELREELSLDRLDVTLLTEAEPLQVLDKDAGLAWVVHPFLFRLLRPQGITTDWEATEHQWVEPGDLSRLSTVPKLAEAFASVWRRRGDR